MLLNNAPKFFVHIRINYAILWLMLPKCALVGPQGLGSRRPHPIMIKLLPIFHLRIRSAQEVAHYAQ